MVFDLASESHFASELSLCERNIAFVTEISHFCRVLGISEIGAKCDFEIWGFKGFLSLDKKNSP